MQSRFIFFDNITDRRAGEREIKYHVISRRTIARRTADNIVLSRELNFRQNNAKIQMKRKQNRREQGEGESINGDRKKNTVVVMCLFCFGRATEKVSKQVRSFFL